MREKTGDGLTSKISLSEKRFNLWLSGNLGDFFGFFSFALTKELSSTMTLSILKKSLFSKPRAGVFFSLNLLAEDL